MKDLLKKEPIRRAIRTFIQAAASYVAVNIATYDITAINAVKGLVISTIAAGIAAAMNIQKTED